jgi:two-component system sensor histidine kinase KdpD
MTAFQLSDPTVRRHATGVLAAAGVVLAVTAAVFVLEPFAPAVSLGVLYVFAVLPVAVRWGLTYAVAVSVASLLVFNWFFLPPKHTLELADSENWVALAVYLVTAVVVSELAARARRRATEAEQRAREAALLAEVSAALLDSDDVEGELPGIAARVAHVLGASDGSIELEPTTAGSPGSTHELAIGDRPVGRLRLEGGERPTADVLRRLLPALASLLAAALDRQRLARTALEAEALRRSDAVKTGILRSVSHDLRSPLTAIRTASEALGAASLDLDEDDRVALLATIDVEARRLERLVADLLDLSRLDAGAAAPRRELWTLDGLVSRALGDLGGSAERVVVTLSPHLPPIEVDGTQIERVLANLLENALKFSSITDPVELAATQERAEVLVRVSDHGVGVQAGDAERIFEPFERADHAGRPRGTGLGLAIARGFAQANDGRLWAETGGAGATFVLALPVGHVVPDVLP